ncbi:MAG: hypothetical protein ACRYG2_08375, partial [Janthinobacterium lividum]
SKPRALIPLTDPSAISSFAQKAAVNRRGDQSSRAAANPARGDQSVAGSITVGSSPAVAVASEYPGSAAGHRSGSAGPPRGRSGLVRRARGPWHFLDADGRIADRCWVIDPETGLLVGSGPRPRNSGSVPGEPDRPAILICADQPPPVVAAQLG